MSKNKLFSFFRKIIGKEESEKIDINFYEEIKRKEELLKEKELKEKFKEHVSILKSNKIVNIYFKDKLTQREKDRIIKDISKKIIVTENKVNIFIEIEYLVEKNLWIHGIKKEKEILIFIDKV